MDFAYGIIFTAAIYLGLGLAFAILFVGIGAGKVDSAAHAAPIGFRLIILPGATALWPILLIKWLSARRPRP